jgi:hypothetical protein
MLAEQREYAECEIFCTKQEPAEHIPLRAVSQKIASGPDCRVLGVYVAGAHANTSALARAIAPYRRASKEDLLCKLSEVALGSCDRQGKDRELREVADRTVERNSAANRFDLGDRRKGSARR